ncbi:MAG TPA: GtrA family protein [Acidimicrobiia bacterium]|nr:GtrA family protein [Acidimicrobiia bacterium]
MTRDGGASTVTGRVVRCLGVSVITTMMSVTTLAIGTAALALPGWVANVVATTLATGPSYTLNRRWTWGRRDASDPWREVTPFWMLSFAGLALSTIFVAVTDAWAHSQQLSTSVRTPLLLVAHLSGFGALWVVQFVLLERVLFGRPSDATPAQSAARSSSSWNIAPSRPGVTGNESAATSSRA